MVHPLWKALLRFFKKLRRELLYNPAIPLECLFKENENMNSKMHMHFYVHCSIIKM